MDLNNVTAELRPRGEWEAVDFGARLVRRDAAAIYKIWFAITLPMLLLTTAAILYSPYPTLATFLYWWFEPITDGPILRVISRRLFGEDADVKSALRALPHLVRRNLIFLLPVYRFHLGRSTAIPITQLEGLKGSDRQSRAKVLNIKIANHGMGVTLAYHHLVLALYIGVYLIVFALIPESYQESVGGNWLELPFSGESRSVALVNLLIFYIAQSALHPWFVGAGFGLYINCRTQLEAWDVEVAFRRMVQRRAAPVTTMLIFLTILGSTMLLPEHSMAEDEAQNDGFVGYWEDDEVRDAMHSTLQNELLETHRTIEEWQSIDSEDAEPPPRDSDSPLWELLRGFGKFMSYILEFGLWIVVAILLALIVITRASWLPYVGFEMRGAKARRRVILSSGEVLADSLPADLPLEVRRLWRDGKKRDALSLLYRGTVFAAVAHYGVRLPRSATEGLCLDAVSEQTERPQADFFARVVQVWVMCAYGFSSPDDAAVIAICEDWQQHFGAPE